MRQCSPESLWLVISNTGNVFLLCDWNNIPSPCNQSSACICNANLLSDCLIKGKTWTQIGNFCCQRILILTLIPGTKAIYIFCDPNSFWIVRKSFCFSKYIKNKVWGMFKEKIVFVVSCVSTDIMQVIVLLVSE